MADELRDFDPTLYSQWISDFVTRNQGQLLGACHRGTAEMVKAFPELRLVRGHVYTLSYGKRGHVWCEAPNGAIVDPTACQFPDIVEYEEWQPGSEVRVGRCMNCGEDIWRAVQSLENVTSECVCSPECDAALRVAYA